MHFDVLKITKKTLVRYVIVLEIDINLGHRRYLILAYTKTGDSVLGARSDWLFKLGISSGIRL